MSGPEGMDQAPDNNEPEIIEADSLPESIRPMTAFDQLKKKRQEIGAQKTKTLPVPGYGGELIARYRLLDWPTIRAIGKRVAKGNAPEVMQEFNVQCDVLITACEELLYQGNGGEPIPLDADNPMRYDLRLSEKMGLNATTSRQVITRLFDNDLALSNHFLELQTWMQDTNPETDEEFLGESQGPTP